MVWAMAGASFATCVAAAEPNVCEAPDYLTHVDGRLMRVTAAVKTERRLDILVIGTGSSTLAGQNGIAAAYPARLEAALRERLPDIKVTVTTDVKSRRTTADMQQTFNKILLDQKPTLVVWQAGTVDAMRGVDPDEFRATLEKGVDTLRAAGTDAILVNMQFSPRTDSMINAGAYIESMRWVAQQHDVPLYDRLTVMKHWSETGAFDLTSPDRTHVAERVHDCIGKMLAELIIDTANLNRMPSKEKH